MSEIRPAWLHAAILGGFCTVFGTALALTDGATREPIRQRALEDKMASLAQVIPGTIHDNNPVSDSITLPGRDGTETVVYRAMMGNRATGFAYEVTAPGGYSGPIKLMLGIAPDGKLLGVRVISHKETPGLGDKIEVAKSDWITRFTGLGMGDPPAEKWAVRKDGGQFDQFSGATITPRAVIGGIRAGMEFFAANAPRMMETR
ncbi:electron transport complex subunit RsxG [Magnetospirillum sp. SS-4]|uniref:electron transport complex subunit RsxG n=1 Tax=Magnetospirillum sp. SS-4 TaxID=2681465 RepID=UPI00137D6F63|nr:electron transport complex subunit RsxG [Magnetospirillum sp. SS-4]CAA7616350.1 putative oxidoreductase [Magnetospirillum sp. SS-4]